MTIVQWGDGYSFMIRVSVAEGLELIQSIARQIQTGDPNDGRAEFVPKNGQYLSISVMPPTVQPEPQTEEISHGCAD